MTVSDTTKDLLKFFFWLTVFLGCGYYLWWSYHSHILTSPADQAALKRAGHTVHTPATVVDRQMLEQIKKDQAMQQKIRRQDGTDTAGAAANGTPASGYQPGQLERDIRNSHKPSPMFSSKTWQKTKSSPAVAPSDKQPQ